MKNTFSNIYEYLPPSIYEHVISEIIKDIFIGKLSHECLKNHKWNRKSLNIFTSLLYQVTNPN